MACHCKSPHVAYATDSMADKQMDLLSHTFTMIENPVASLVKFYPATLEKIALWTEGWMEGKITLLLHTLTMGGGGIHVASLVKFCPLVWEKIALRTDGWTVK